MTTSFLDFCFVCVFLAFAGFASINGKMHGPEGNMIGILVIPVALLFGGSLMVSVHRGAMDWMPGGRMAQYAVVLGLVVGVSAFSIVSFGIRHKLLSPLCAAVPLVVVGAAIVMAHTAAGRNIVASVLGVVAVAGWLVMIIGFGVYVKDSVQVANQRAQEERAREEERSRSDLAEFRALGADAPLRQLMEYTYSPNDAVQKEARVVISARPNLEDELIAMLRDGAGDSAASYIARVHPAPSSKLAPAFASFLESELPGWQSRLMGSPNPGMWQPNISSFFYAADRIQKAGGDLRPQLKQWHDYLKTVSGMNGMTMHIAPMLR